MSNAVIAIITHVIKNKLGKTSSYYWMVLLIKNVTHQMHIFRCKVIKLLLFYHPKMFHPSPLSFLRQSELKEQSLEDTIITNIFGGFATA